MIKPTKSTVTKRQKYTAGWNTIKSAGLLELVVEVNHQSAVEFGILRAKSRENTARRAMELSCYNKLAIVRETISDQLVKLTFSLSHDDRLL